MDTEIVTTAAGLAELRTEWEAMEARDVDAPYYVHHRFVSAWWSAFAPRDDVDLHVVCVTNNNRLVAIAPFSVRRQVRGELEISHLEFATHGDYRSVLVDPEANANQDTILKTVMDHVRASGCHKVNLGNVPTDTPFAHYLLKSRYNDDFRHHVENPFVDLAPFDDFDDFETRRVPKNARKYRNKLLRDHDVSFRVVHGGGPELVERLATLHRAEKDHLTEQGREGRRSLFEEPARRGHVEAVFATTDDPVTFLYERADGDLVGYRTCYLHDRVLLSWNSAYHPDFEDYRVGRALQYDIFRALFADRFADRFDFGAGRYPWKFEWTGDFTTTYRLAMTLARPEPAEAPVGAAPDDHDDGPNGRDADDHDEAGRDEAREDDPRRAREPAGLEGRSGDARRRPTWHRLARRLVRSERNRRRALAVRDRARSVVRRLRGRRSGGTDVWYVPHPDDEALFMAASLHGRRDGTNVVVLLTRGGASRALEKIRDHLDAPIDRDEFMAGRVREFVASTARLGIDPAHRTILDLPDGSLMVAQVREAVRAMERRHPGATHHTMSFLDPHPDHRAAGEAVLAAHHAGEISACLFHLPIPATSDDLGEEVAITRAANVVKQAALAEYAVWDPGRGRYAVGTHSVAAYMQRQATDPTERVHGPDQRAG